MKGLCLTVFLGLAVILNGCGTASHAVKSDSRDQMKNPQMQDFFNLGDVIQTANGIQLTVAADKLFRKNSSHLSKEGAAKVDSIAAAILKYPNDTVVIDGYTDNAGSDAKNVKFSQHQADRIKAELVKQGIAKTRLTAMGNGSAEPVADNGAAEGKAKNRRIVFQISKP